MNLPKTYIVYDLETTGLNYKEDEAVEIGALKVIDGVEVERRVWLLRPSVPMNEQASEVTGITQELLEREGRDPKECWQEFAEFCGFTKDNHGLNIPIVGHNILRFDNLFISKALTDLGYLLEGTTIYVDTAGIYKAEALKLEQRPGEPDIEFMNRALSIKAYGLKYSLGKVFEEYGGDPAALQDAHRVDGDITMTNFIYSKLIEKMVCV